MPRAARWRLDLDATSLRPRAAALSRARREWLLRMQDQLLHPPIEDFGDIEHVLVRAGDGMDPAELLELFAGAAEHAQNLAVEAQLVDAAGESVGDIEHLVRRRRDAQRPWRAGRHGAAVLQVIGQVRLVADRRLRLRLRRNVDGHDALKFAVAVEYLDAAVAAVGDVDGALGVG